jgi:hypothetical protein
MAKRTTKKKARRAPRKGKRKATRRRSTVVYHFQKRKAVRAKPRRKRATGYTVGSSPIRRRKLNGVRKRRKTINGTINGTMNTSKLMNAAKGGVLVFAGSRGARILSAKVGANLNPNLKAAGVILVGALFHGKAPDLMKGVIAEGVGMIADPMLVNAGVMNGPSVINGYLTDDDVDAVEEAAMNGADDDDYNG